MMYVLSTHVPPTRDSDEGQGRISCRRRNNSTRVGGGHRGDLKINLPN